MNSKNINEKSVMIRNIIIAIIFIVIGTVSLIKNKIDKSSYNNTYEELQVEEVLKEEDKFQEMAEESNKIKVYVTGAVNNPGVKELDEQDRIEDAIKLSGGVKEDANLEEVNLAYQLEDGMKIYIPKEGEEAQYISIENGEKIVEKANSIGNSKQNNLKVNINTGEIEELKTLPGVGESLAKRIIDYREKNGKFKVVEDLKEVSGIGDKKFEGLKDYIVVR